MWGEGGGGKVKEKHCRLVNDVIYHMKKGEGKGSCITILTGGRGRRGRVRREKGKGVKKLQ